MADIVPLRDDDSPMVLSRYWLASSDMLTTLSRWRNLLQMYEQGTLENLQRKVDERGRIDHNDQTISNVTASTMFNAVETQTPRLLQLWNPEGWFEVVPRRGTPYGNAQYIKEKMQKQLDDGEFYEVIYPATKQAVKLGTSIVKIGWDIEFGVVYDRRLVSQGKEAFVPRNGVVYDAPRIELVPYYNFFVDPAGTSLNTCEYVIEEGIVSHEWLTKQADLGLYYDKDAIQAVLGDQSYQWGSGVYGQGGYDPQTLNDPKAMTHDGYRKNCRILSYWEDRRFITVALPTGANPKQGVVLNTSNQENPFDHNQKPFARLSINIHETNFFAPGIMESLRDNQAVQSTIINMLLDAAIQTIRPQKIIATGIDGLDVDIKEMEGYIPNRVIELKNLPLNGRSVRDMIYDQKPDPNSLMMLPQLLSIMRGEAQEMSGMTDYLTGNATVGSNKTARGAALLSANANIRNSTSTLAMALGATRILNQCLLLNQQFGKPEEPQYGEFNLKVFGDAMADSSVRMGTLQGMLGAVAMAKGNVVEVMRRILQIGGETGIDMILPNDGSMQQGQVQDGMGQIMQMLAMQGQKNA